MLSRLCSALAADPKMGYYGVTGERSTARPVHLHTSLAVYPATPAGSFLCLELEKVETWYDMVWDVDLGRLHWCGLFLSLAVAGTVGAAVTIVN